MDRGWIRLYRRIQDNSLWKEKPFDRARAWQDLILKANYKDDTLWVRGMPIQIKRGQVGWSQIKLAEEWGWSRNKVRRFLDYLKKEEQISQETIQQNKHLTSLITLINYDLYNSNDTTDETPSDTADEQQKDNRRYSKKKEKNLKKEKKEEGTPAQPFFDLWNTTFKGLDIAQARKLTKDRKKKIILRLKECSLGEWEIVFFKIRDSSFCCGSNDRSWKASLDWIIANEENGVKVLEGKYDNQKEVKKPNVNICRSDYPRPRNAFGTWRCPDAKKNAEDFLICPNCNRNLGKQF